MCLFLLGQIRRTTLLWVEFFFEPTMFLWAFLLLLSASHGQRRKEQKPKPLQIGEPVLYPEDYCREFDGGTIFDYVVVGAGPAGGTVARRLAEDKTVHVLVLEAGGDPNPITDVTRIAQSVVSKEELWPIPTEKSDKQCLGYENEVCVATFGKFLGGSSVINAMMYVRGNQRDYDEWQAQNCPGWGWKNMFPYFKKLENFQDPLRQLHPDPYYHNQGGPFTTSPSLVDPQIKPFQDAFVRALKNNKIPETKNPNGKRQTGFGQLTASKLSNGYRGNSATAYLLNIPDNLKVCKNSVVHKLQISDDKTVTGVEFVYKGDKKMTAKGKEYILSAGPISSPQILERSGIGRKDVLEAAGVKQVLNLEGVGENLYEHVGNTGCTFALDLNTQTEANPLSISLNSLALFLNLTDYTSPVSDVQLYFISVPPGLYSMFQPEIAEQYAEIQKTRHLVVTMPSVLRQTNPGYVHIKSSDPLTPPTYQPNQFTSSYETKVHSEGCRLMRKIMQDAVLKPFNPEPVVLNKCKIFQFNSDDEIMCQARHLTTLFHHIAGTTKMGHSSDKKAVVDVKMRVHGVKNLRVVDLGIMPFNPRGNAEIPTIAVAERAADIIKGQ